jgi:hypothetical protein
MPILTKANDWGGTSISRELYDFLKRALPEGDTLLELGSGWGSSQLMKRWNLISIENEERFFKKFNPQSFLVPTTHDEGWYKPEVLEEALQGLTYDFLLIDGPHHGREHFPEHLDLFDTSVPMIFDDINRPVGKKAIKDVSEIVGRPFVIYHPNTRHSFGFIEGAKVEDWGAWSIDKSLYNYIRKVMPDGGTILELGSGWSTSKLSEHYTMYSVEHDEEFVGKYNSTYIHAPLKEHKRIRNHKTNIWYDADVLRKELKGIKYDLLLIDGPPGTRSGFFKYIDLFDSSAIWVFDDTNRGVDHKVVNSSASKLGSPIVTYHGSTSKTYSVLNNPLLKQS